MDGIGARGGGILRKHTGGGVQWKTKKGVLGAGTAHKGGLGAGTTRKRGVLGAATTGKLRGNFELPL